MTHDRSALRNSLLANDWVEGEAPGIYDSGRRTVMVQPDGSVVIRELLPGSNWCFDEGLDIKFGIKVPDVLVAITCLAAQAEPHAPF